MPTYQYACTECGEALEVVQKFTDDALTTCPSCGGALRKVFSAVGVVFKGSGFYRTDSRSSNGAASGKKPDSAGGSTESKPADKPAASTSAEKSGSSTTSTSAGSAA